MNFSLISQLCGQDLETRRSSGRGGHRHTMLVLHPDPFPMKLRFQIPKSNPRVLPGPQLFPEPRNFPGCSWLEPSSCISVLGLWKPT